MVNDSNAGATYLVLSVLLLFASHMYLLTYDSYDVDVIVLGILSVVAVFSLYHRVSETTSTYCGPHLVGYADKICSSKYWTFP